MVSPHIPAVVCQSVQATRIPTLHTFHFPGATPRCLYHSRSLMPASERNPRSNKVSFLLIAIRLCRPRSTPEAWAGDSERLKNENERDEPADRIPTKPVWDWTSPIQMVDERAKAIYNTGVESDMKWPTPLQMLKGQLLLVVEGQASG